jgi:HAD superfamily hydrolase (TIGR01549 family)
MRFNLTMGASYHEGRVDEGRVLSGPRPLAVLLDVGFTLTFWDGARIAAHAARAGVTVSAAAVERAESLVRAEMRELESRPLRTHDDGGERFLGGVFRRLLQLADATGDAETLERASRIIHAEHLKQNVWRRVGAGNREALERLRAGGFRLAVVSNSEGTVEAMLEDVGLRPFFETVVDSTVVGTVKPDASIYRIALDRLLLAPADAIMVGDSPTADVHGAHTVGLTAALIDPLDLYPWVPAPRFPDLAAFTTALLKT